MGFRYTQLCVHKSKRGNAPFTFWLIKMKCYFLNVIFIFCVCYMYCTVHYPIKWWLQRLKSLRFSRLLFCVCQTCVWCLVNGEKRLIGVFAFYVSVMLNRVLKRQYGDFSLLNTRLALPVLRDFPRDWLPAWRHCSLDATRVSVLASFSPRLLARTRSDLVNSAENTRIFGK